MFTVHWHPDPILCASCFCFGIDGIELKALPADKASPPVELPRRKRDAIQEKLLQSNNDFVDSRPPILNRPRFIKMRFTLSEKVCLGQHCMRKVGGWQAGRQMFRIPR